jgi:hypothetical protein
MEIDLLEYPINKYVDIISNKFKLKKRPIKKYIKSQNWQFKCKLELCDVKIGIDSSGKRYHILSEDLAILIENN